VFAVIRIPSRVLGETSPSRVWGDEFTVLLDHIKDPGDAKRAADRMMKALAAPSFWGERGVHLREHRNCAKPAAYELPEDILRDADTAMYRAKSLGRPVIEVFRRGICEPV